MNDIVGGSATGGGANGCKTSPIRSMATVRVEEPDESEPVSPIRRNPGSNVQSVNRLKRYISMTGTIVRLRSWWRGTAPHRFCGGAGQVSERQRERERGGTGKTQ